MVATRFVVFASILGLAVAEGIKQLLLDNGFSSVDVLAKSTPAELAAILGIDLYVARLIYIAARKHHEIDNDETDVTSEEQILTPKALE